MATVLLVTGEIVSVIYHNTLVVDIKNANSVPNNKYLRWLFETKKRREPKTKIMQSLIRDFWKQRDARHDEKSDGWKMKAEGRLQ